MYVRPEDVVSLVTSEQAARDVIASLTQKFASEVTRQELRFEARTSHQTEAEIARRTAGNLLRSGKLRRDRNYYGVW